jgi:ferredoxin
MATVITSECINCGACEPECPNTAIYQGGVEWDLNGVKHAPVANDIFFIVPEKCTECVGFFDHEACAAVCPVDCCVPDPNIPETEDVLIARARALHPDTGFPGDFPSRFRKEGAAPAAASAAGAAPAAAPAPAEMPAPEAPAPKAAMPAPPPAASAAPAPAAATAKPVPAPTAAAPRLPPAASASAVVATAETALGIPEIEEWEVPIECFHCRGTYAVAFKHFRSGVVFYCPFCQGSYVITTSMHNHISRALREFHAEWRRQFDNFQARRRRELEEFEERQRARLEVFNESLKNASHEFKPPGAPRKRAWIFG